MIDFKRAFARVFGVTTAVLYAVMLLWVGYVTGAYITDQEWRQAIRQHLQGGLFRQA